MIRITEVNINIDYIPANVNINGIIAEKILIYKRILISKLNFNQIIKIMLIKSLWE